MEGRWVQTCSIKNKEKENRSKDMWFLLRLCAVTCLLNKHVAVCIYMREAGEGGWEKQGIVS